MSPPGFFDLDNRYKSISKLGDPLEVLSQAIPWETFRPVLSKVLRKFKKSSAGRKPYDSVFMFKILVLQSLYKLSDDQMEFQIKDRLSFMRFLGLDFEDTVPDAKTLWLFRDTLANKNTIDKLFRKFTGELHELKQRKTQIIIFRGAHKLRMIIGGLYVAFIIFMSLVPADSGSFLPDIDPSGNSVLSHFIAYFIMMLWYAQIYPAKYYPNLAAIFILLGIGLEFLQGMTATREFQAIDILFNSSGVACAWWFAKARFTPKTFH